MYSSQQIKQNPSVSTSLVHLIRQIAAERLPEGKLFLCWETLLNIINSAIGNCLFSGHLSLYLPVTKALDKPYEYNVYFIVYTVFIEYSRENTFA